MSDKMICPGCYGESSDLLASVRNGDGCPYCGLSSEAIDLVNRARDRSVEEELVQKLLNTEMALISIKSENQVLKRVVSQLRTVVTSAEQSLREIYSG